MNTSRFPELTDCTICPRKCHTNRSVDVTGFCGSGTGFHIGSICVHKGEEPVLSGTRGMCNVFFTRCNMRCIYCQNAQISRNRGPIMGRAMPLTEVVEQIEEILETGISMVGFVSPSHVIPQMRAIIEAIRSDGLNPTFVMNTNAYDKVETIASLADMIDVYLPDLKYMDSDLAASYSATPDYPQVATAAIAEMYRQKGEQTELDSEGLIRSGLIIRHLVLPGQIENSKQCLRFVAKHLSPKIHISVMSQYHPTEAVRDHPLLGRTLHPEEYEEVLDEMDHLGLENGWIQEMESDSEYVPDFSSPNPFESA
ncbi:MAG TPA: radical SAM protein [Candidatus Acetothermia bacterium]|nr:radical SAM protein [Candidatus Acetothermia bacterium]